MIRICSQYVPGIIPISWTSQFLFNWNLCEVLMSQGLFTKYVQYWLIMPPFPVHHEMAHFGKAQDVPYWKPRNILFLNISNNAAMITFFCEHELVIVFTLQWESNACMKVHESAWQARDFCVWKWVKSRWSEGHLEWVKLQDFEMAAHPLKAF